MHSIAEPASPEGGGRDARPPSTRYLHLMDSIPSIALWPARFSAATGESRRPLTFLCASITGRRAVPFFSLSQKNNAALIIFGIDGGGAPVVNTMGDEDCRIRTNKQAKKSPTG